MSSYLANRALRVVFGGLVLAAGLVLGPMSVHHAGATLSTCGGCANFGPLIYLSDGTKINTSVGVNDQMSDIQSVSYVVHVPTNVSVTSYSFQGSNQVSQSVTWVNDQLFNTYLVDTYVTTGTQSLVYPATQVNKGWLGSCTNSGVGLSNSDVFVSLSC